MKRRIDVIFSFLICMLSIIGCKLSISTFTAPDTANTGTIITLTVKGTAKNIDDKASAHGIILQLPDGWSVISLTTNVPFGMGVAEDFDIAALYTAETDHFVWAGKMVWTDSTDRDVTATIKVLTGNFTGSYGQTKNCNVKVIVGAERQGMWISDDPENVFDFSDVIGEKYVETINVTKINDITAPDPITTLTANIETTSNVNLSWTGYDEELQGDVVKYRVYRSLNVFSDIRNADLIAECKAGTQYYRDNTIIPNTEYHYAVTAVDEIGNENKVVKSVSINIPIPASISGVVYEHDGTTPMTVKIASVTCLIKDPCNYEQVGTDATNKYNGTYNISNLIPGTYYLKASYNNNNEWWASPKSQLDCHDAQAVVVSAGENIIGKNFQLDIVPTPTPTPTPTPVPCKLLEVLADGVYSWNKTTNQWTKISGTEDAVMIATGKIDSDNIDDLIGVWPSGLFIKQSSNGQWIKISSTLPIWITAGDINNDGRDDVIGSWKNDGVYFRDSTTGKWFKLSTSARQIAAGNIGGTRDDLIGVWNDGLWVRFSTNASWQKIDSNSPIWITTGDMTGDQMADIIASYSTGTWYRNSANGGWTKITTPAEQLTTGDIDGDGRDDLIGIWSNSLWVRYGATNQWQQVTTSKPKWISTGKIVESIQSFGSLDDPNEFVDEIIDLSNEGPGGINNNDSVPDNRVPEMSK